MYTFVYPETNTPLLPSLTFATPQEAVAWWQDKRPTWQPIQHSPPHDHAAFLDPVSGHIVVVRSIES